ncbi:hypothetical protein CspHIS471_0402700 [Cutaneotrichosporon sp. HIS471]|nr:hypothetical protein CspHIS471_0402700 [Cutaneotrichosporon sp. HIS471]
MFLSSFRLIRRIAYEFFLLTHIVMGIAFLVAVYAHVPNEWYQRLVWPSMFLWGLDRLVSFGRIVMVNKGWLFFTSKRVERGCIAELVSPEVVRLRVRRPMLRWQAGQHAFITMPGVARLRYEQHPFTMANIPDNSGDAVFLIRAQSGFTGRLVGRLTSTKEDINCYLDGPYGTPHNLNHYRGVLLVAGGTGVTHMLAHLAAIVKASRERTSVCSFVRLIWNVREEGAVGWIAPMLNVALAEGTGTVRVYVDIFATRSHLSDEPNTEEYPAFQHLGNVVTQVDTPETPSQTPGGSSSELSTLTSEEATEKRVQNENIVKSLRYGLSGPAVATVKFHRGRSNVEILLRTDVETVPSNWSVAVGVCGPMELMLDARRAVCTVNSAGAVFKGQPPIDLYCETFGW